MSKKVKTRYAWEEDKDIIQIIKRYQHGNPNRNRNINRLSGTTETNQAQTQNSGVRINPWSDEAPELVENTIDNQKAMFKLAQSQQAAESFSGATADF